MKKQLKIFLIVIQVILGVTFIISGFTKAIDPVGGVYKLEDYFLIFKWTLPWNVNLILSIVQGAVEFILGILLLSGIWEKNTRIVVLLFMLLMTPFTLYLAIANPFTDCGCFGDAIKLSNWETFGKNVVLLGLSLILVISGKPLYSFYGTRSCLWCFLWALLFPVLLSSYALLHSPAIDFRPFKNGKDLKVLTRLPETAVTDSFVYDFVYEKDGKRKSFSIDEIAKMDTGWHYIERKSIQVRVGDKPEIDNLEILDNSGNKMTDFILDDTSYVFLFISPDLSKSDRNDIDKINEVYTYCESLGYSLYGITSSDKITIDEWTYEYDAKYEFYSLDSKVSATITRTNPGLVLLKNGVILQKWAMIDVPDFSKINIPLNETSYGQVNKMSPIKTLGLLIIIFFAPLIILSTLHLGRNKLKKVKKSAQNESDNKQTK
jgi:uncharacterized membrane protein YphA (DoxX/SURF4 family)